MYGLGRISCVSHRLTPCWTMSLPFIVIIPQKAKSSPCMHVGMRGGGGHTFFVPSYISLFAHSRVVQTLGMKGEKTWHPPSKGGMHRQGHMEKGGGGCKLCVFASPTPFGHLLACHITHRRGEHTDSRCRREEGGRVLSNPSHTSPITIHISVYWVTWPRHII